MLNWILRYPFKRGGVNEKACEFGSDAKVYEYKVAKVYVDEMLQGAYVLRQHDDELSVVYLYYREEKRDVVCDAILDQIITLRPKSFITENVYLYERVREGLYFPQKEEEQVSLSMQEVKGEFTMQMGDGDGFA